MLSINKTFLNIIQIQIQIKENFYNHLEQKQSDTIIATMYITLHYNPNSTTATSLHFTQKRLKSYL